MNNYRVFAMLPLLALAALASTGSAAAATLSDLGLSEAQKKALQGGVSAPVSAPGIAFGSPVAFGAGSRQAFFGIGGETLPSTSTEDVDGSMSLGFGLGNPDRSVGLEVAATLISISDDFGADGNVNLKLHHSLPYRAAIAVGVENTGRWGDARNTSSSTYFVATKVFDLKPGAAHPVPVSVNLGFGDQRFNEPGEDGANLFGSLAVSPLPWASFIVDWTGRDTNAGVSVVPFLQVPLVLTVGAVNLGERFGATTEFSGGIGALFRF